ncbi:hypothetical protein [Gordonia sp. NPDC003376]
MPRAWCIGAPTLGNGFCSVAVEVEVLVAAVDMPASPFACP